MQCAEVAVLLDSFDEFFQKVGPVGGEIFTFDSHAEAVRLGWVEVEFTGNLGLGGGFCQGDAVEGFDGVKLVVDEEHRRGVLGDKAFG